MKRLRQLCGLMVVALMVGAGCTEANNPWLARQNRSQSQEPVASAPVPEQTVRQEPEPTATEPTPDTVAENANETVADFVRRLQMQDQSGDDAAAGVVAVVAAPADDDTTGMASTSANRGVAIPGPGQESESVSPPSTPVQATEAPHVESVSIVTAAPGAEETTDARTLSTNEPLDATAVAEEYSIRKYIEMLEEALRDDAADVELQWLLSTLRLVMGEDDRATAISDEIAREPAELLCDGVRFFADLRELLVDPSHPADETLAVLETLRTRLRERAELEIPVVALCSRVRTFGVYDEMPPGHFDARQTNRTVVYSEVKNFVSNKLDDGRYETLLAGRLELLTDDGRLVWDHEEPTIKEVSRQRREDFFLAQLVTFPAGLTPGDYVLKVMIQDLLGGKANEAHVEFTVGSRQVTSTSP